VTVVPAAVREKKDKILELYQEGYSQKDIAERCSITPKDIRQMLKEAGFETKRFRALDENTINIILQLITKGVQFKEVEDVCNIAVHATRDVVARNNLQRASKRARQEGTQLAVPEDFQKNPEFLIRYLAGESFCALCEEYRLSNDDIVNEFLSFTEAQVRQHNDMLKQKVREDASLHFSPTAIARRRRISMSVVRNILQG